MANNFQGNLGGPIIKNKFFFFASYDHVKRSVPTPITINPANAALIGIPIRPVEQSSRHRVRAVGGYTSGLGDHAEESVFYSLQLFPKSISQTSGGWML